MKPPILKKERNKKIHNTTLVDYYSWVHQKNILEVLSDPSKLDKEVKSYLDEENKYTNLFFLDTKKLQKKLFNEIKGRIKLADKSVPFKDKRYTYWTKTTEKGNYSIHLRKTKLKKSKKLFGMVIKKSLNISPHILG